MYKRQDRVNAQQARRVLDRLVGYKLSPLLWVKVKKGLSAGRVQSVAVRLICDREAEINAFVPEEYWTLEALLETEDGVLKAKLAKIANKKAEIHNEEEMQQILQHLADASYQVAGIQKRKKERKPVAPFTTSSLQQEAYRKYGLVTKRTMQIAQQLYEGVELGKEGVVGLITYMRTDSTRVSPEAQKATLDFIEERYGKEFLPKTPRQYTAKGKKIQDAHEAIRPSSVLRLPSQVKQFLKPQQYKLYKLIWERFVASQMASAIMDVTTIDVEAKDCLFRASGSVIHFPGFMQIYIEGRDDDEKEDLGLLPTVVAGQLLQLQKLEPKQHFTQPPPRYTEAMLVKTMEEKGVGRPSTYAPTIDTILNRGYVVREEKHFYSTELGSIVVDLLKESFPDIIDIDFTANMEKSLDDVEEGNVVWQDVVADFYGPFSKDLQKAEESLEKVEIEPEYSGEYCEKCGKPMVYKLGRYGKFLACSGFPECRNTKPIIIDTGVKCLKCGGNIIQRKSRGGRIFYGCSNYPNCNYVAWDKPIEETCPTCGWQLTERTNKSGVTTKICPNKDCSTNAKAKAAKKSKKTELEKAVQQSVKERKQKAKKAEN